jgi:methionyl aminopeptidase
MLEAWTEGQLLLLTRLFQEELGMSATIIIFQDHNTNSPEATHKLLHRPSSSNPLRSLFSSAPKVVSLPDPITGTYNPFPTFPFTGSLRPVYPLSETRKVPAHIQKPDYARDGIPKSERLPGRQKVTILNAEEIEGMRKVCRLTREVLDAAAAAVKPGVTTDELDEIVHNACIERDVRSWPRVLHRV